MMKFTLGIQRNSKIFYKLILPFWVHAARHAQSIQNRKFAYLCNISRKTWGMNLLFCLQINTKVFYKVLLSVWMCVNSLAQSTHNNKIFLQILSQGKKKISIWVWQRKPKLPKIKSLLLHISMKVSCKLVLCFWMGMVKHSPK